MKQTNLIKILTLTFLISCGGGGSDNKEGSEGNKTGETDTTPASLPRSIFFEGCVDVACAEKKITQVNLDDSDSFNFIALSEYDSTFASIDSVAYLNNKIYFSAKLTAGGNYQLWSYEPLKDIEAGVNPRIISNDAVGDIAYEPSNLTVAEDKVFFSAQTAANGRELWVYDTSLEPGVTNPSLVYDVNNGAADANPKNLIFHNQKLFFVAEDPANGIEVRSFDPALPVSPTNPLTSNINPGANSGLANGLKLIGDKIYFSAFDGPDNGTTTHGVEAWVLDTTLAIDGSNPSLAVDLTTSPAGSFPENFVGVGAFIYFTATDSTNGTELRKYDPSLPVDGANPVVIDIIVGAGSAGITSLYAKDNKLYFNVDDTAGNGHELWVLDNTEAIGVGNPVELFDLEVGGDSSPKVFGGFGSSIVFEAETAVYGRELWIYDVSQAISAGVNPRVVDIITGANSNQIKNYVLSF